MCMSHRRIGTSLNLLIWLYNGAFVSSFPCLSIFAFHLFLCANVSNQRCWLAYWWPLSCLTTEMHTNTQIHYSVLLSSPSPSDGSLSHSRLVCHRKAPTNSKDRKWRRASAYQALRRRRIREVCMVLSVSLGSVMWLKWQEVWFYWSHAQLGR